MMIKIPYVGAIVQTPIVYCDSLKSPTRDNPLVAASRTLDQGSVFRSRCDITMTHRAGGFDLIGSGK